MKKYIWMLFSCLFLVGCVSVDLEPDMSSISSAPMVASKDLSNIGHVYAGMSLKEVRAIMGNALEVGYEKVPGETEFSMISINSPYKEEELTLSGESYLVLYYFTRIQKADGLVSDDELTPLIFENKKLVGLGWDALFKLKS